MYLLYGRHAPLMATPSATYGCASTVQLYVGIPKQRLHIGVIENAAPTPLAYLRVSGDRVRTYLLAGLLPRCGVDVAGLSSLVLVLHFIEDAEAFA